MCAEQAQPQYYGKCLIRIMTLHGSQAIRVQHIPRERL